MKRLVLLWTCVLSDTAARHVTARASLTALFLFLLATAGLHQMEAAYGRSVVTQGSYSLVETERHAWRAPELRVGWKRQDAYIPFREHAVFQSLAIARGASLSCLLLTPALWLAAAALRRRHATLTDTPDADEVVAKA